MPQENSSPDPELLERAQLLQKAMMVQDGLSTSKSMTPGGAGMGDYLDQSQRPGPGVQTVMNQLPAAGAIAGGLIGKLGGKAGEYVGAGVGGAGGEYLKNAESNLRTGTPMPDDLGNRMLRAGGAGVAGQAVGNFIGGPVANSFMKSGVEDIAQLGNRPGANAIKAAATKLGTTPTPGMLTSDTSTRNLENTLGQSNTIPGSYVRGQQEQVYDAMQNAAQSATKDANQVGSVDAGRDIKRGIFDYVRGRNEPIKQAYSEVEGQTKNIPIAIDDSGRKRVAANMLNVSGTQFSNSDPARIANQFSEWLSEAKNIDDIKQLKTMARQIVEDQNSSPAAKRAGQEIFGKLDRFHQNAITRSLINKARAEATQVDVTSPEFAPEGNEAFPYAKPAREAKEAEQASLEQGAKDIQTNKDLVTQAGETGKSNAKDLIQKSKTAGNQYAGLMGDLEKIGKGTGFSKPKPGKGPEGFLSDIDEIKPEELARAFDSGDEELMAHIEKTMPDVYETMKQQKLNDIVARASDASRKIVPAKLAKNIQSLSPQMQTRLFGEEGKAGLDAMGTLSAAIPPKVGVSDTPRGIKWSSAITNPINNLTDAANLGFLKAKPYFPAAGGLLKKAAPVVKYGTSGLLGPEDNK